MTKTIKLLLVVCGLALAAVIVTPYIFKENTVVENTTEQKIDSLGTVIDTLKLKADSLTQVNDTLKKK